jgi:mRNA interferase MazF
MKAGDIVLARIPQADVQFKLRPALILCLLPPFSDFLVCGVSTQLRHRVTGFDEIVDRTDPDFPASGLRQDSLIRLGFLNAIPETSIAGVLGSIAAARLQRLRLALANHLRSRP